MISEITDKLMEREEWERAYARSFSRIKGPFVFDPRTGSSHPEFVGFRMSSMGDCARRLYYDGVMGGEGRVEEAITWPQAIGYAGQELAAEALKGMGYRLFDQENEVTWENMVGHTDGMLTGYDLGDMVATWDAKVKNSFAFRDMVTKGLPRADVGIYVQQMCYIKATGADCGIVTVHAADHTDTRSRLKQYKVEANPLVHRIVLERDEEVFELIEERAYMLELAVGKKTLPACEYDPIKGQFPCTYCPHMQQCILDGDEKDYTVTPFPSEWRGGDGR